jgi:hypothetical protein
MRDYTARIDATKKKHGLQKQRRQGDLAADS